VDVELVVDLDLVLDPDPDPDNYGRAASRMTFARAG
jgi:hypothetical protein